MVNIIGAGLAGSILKRVLDENRIKNHIYDCEKPWRASVISENLFSPSWSKTLGEKLVGNGIKTLESVVDISSINFKTLAGHNEVLHVHPKNILVPYVKKEVDIGCFGSGITIDCRGYWATVKEEMLGLTGQGVFISGKLDGEPIMNFVAPYTHQKLFQWDKNRIWYGDSTCIQYDKYVPRMDYYTDRCLSRAARLSRYAATLLMRPVYGIRPQVKGHKGYLRLNRKLIINTGGWKCGLIIYADQARKILKYIQGL